ncbi:cell division protein FtsI (penicillin-binding protein 3) [Actinoplanes campanulatus]|uniref:Cell division protein FtsI (Penicillin-binding protein 3) n=1 Tax=Actinoplanes campanulatus TaxID=113559 RepID=A0A7W5ACB2_9ACTN|nr:penicillin-binding protein 2 [Actinoplanes campanulatus]MBB3093546.1 cell division protein FtsI (penicillin-binding protein 3) [Actinoplanes campanulatus]GGN04097.1 penicillin-binding protein PbpB [Actinoplanes campanulatus]GID35379.1 penicillin-binding protein PbpB [Actinoplanes campanulatus]
MTPRDEDEAPRRGKQPRRGSSRDLPGDEQPDDPREGRRGFSSIGEARAYTPRGRTVAERGRLPRTGGRNADPFRPALQVLDGGESGQRTRGRGRPAEQPPAPRESKADKPRESKAGKPRESKVDKPRGGRADKPRAADKPRERQPERRERESSTRTRNARTGNGGAGPRRTVASRPKPVPAEPPKLANSTRRLRLGTVLALSLFVTIGVRLVVLQVATSPEEAESLLKLRENRLSTVALPAPRGSILDRDGHVLAHSVEARYVYVDPENEDLRKDVAGTAAKLAPLLGIRQSELLEDMRRKQVLGKWLKFRYLARGVPVAVADEIEELGLPGIYTHSDERRDVPGRDLAANLIGFTGDDHHGLEGLEARYDDLLHGTDGKRVFEVGTGKKLNLPIPSGFQQETSAQPGSSLQLTIDQDLQYQVQRVLNTAGRKQNATVGSAVVLDIKTGEVLAQASYPPYNAADAEKYDADERIDAASSIVTDPGSSHKAFIFGAALQEGLIKPDELIEIGPAIKKGDTKFEDTHPQDTGTRMTLPGLMAYSSNVGTILIADRLGKEKVYEYQRKFGLGKATGEGMPGEAEGELLEPEDWSGSSYGSVPIGHSVSATLIQMAAGFAAIANDGVYIQPHLIKATISGEDGEVTPAAAPETHRVLDTDVARQLRLIMEAVVDVDGGTGGAAAVQGYRVAGKTGTGKMLIDGQYTSHNASSFIGMAPADNPRYVIGVSMDVREGGGGDVAAPAFSEMMNYTLLHNHVPPSGSKVPKFKIKE